MEPAGSMGVWNLGNKNKIAGNILFLSFQKHGNMFLKILL